MTKKSQEEKEKEKIKAKALLGLAIIEAFGVYWEASTRKQKITLITYWFLFFLFVSGYGDFKDNYGVAIAETLNIQECYVWQLLQPIFICILAFFLYWGTQSMYKRFEINYKLNKSQKYWLGFLILMFVGIPIFNLISILTGQADPC